MQRAPHPVPALVQVAVGHGHTAPLLALLRNECQSTRRPLEPTCDHRGVSPDATPDVSPGVSPDTSTDWTEVGDRCWVRRYAEWDVNVGVVAGSDGVLVVDTRGTRQQGAALRDHVRRLVPGLEVRWVVNTHQHFDHPFGNI